MLRCPVCLVLLHYIARVRRLQSNPVDLHAASRYTDRTFIVYKTSMPGGSLLKQGQHVYCEDSHNMGGINVEVRPEAP